jgi:hypothetical protein
VCQHFQTDPTPSQIARSGWERLDGRREQVVQAPRERPHLAPSGHPLLVVHRLLEIEQRFLVSVQQTVKLASTLTDR